MTRRDRGQILTRLWRLLAIGVVIALLTLMTTVDSNKEAAAAGRAAVGHVLSSQAQRSFSLRSGEQMHSDKTLDIQSSFNWSGLVEQGSGLDGAGAKWTVPAVQSSSPSGYSSTWVGVDGVSNDDLIQTGTEQDSFGNYYAWYEILPAPQTVITNGEGGPATVQPGDQMVASVALASPNVWTIYLRDVSQGWYYEQNFNYYGPGTSAEWVEEAPTGGGRVLPLANFGTVNFAGTAVYGDLGSDGTAWYGTDMDSSNEVEMLNTSDTAILAIPSAPSPDPTGGQDFSDTYVDTPIATTTTSTSTTTTVPIASPSIVLTSPTNQFQLSDIINVSYTAADAVSPVAYYNIDYRWKKWRNATFGAFQTTSAWTDTTATSQSLVGSPGTEYCFTVQAVAASGAASIWSQIECATIPLGQTLLRPVTGHWKVTSDPSYYLGTYTTANRYGATLRLKGVWSGQLAVVAAECPTCGVIKIYVNGKLKHTFDTYSATLTPQDMFTLYAPTNGVDTVVIKDASRNGVVQIEGLGVSQ